MSGPQLPSSFSLTASSCEARGQHSAACLQSQKPQHQWQGASNVSMTKDQQQVTDHNAPAHVDEQQPLQQHQRPSSAIAQQSQQQQAACQIPPALSGQHTQQQNSDLEDTSPVQQPSMHSSLGIQQQLGDQAALLRQLSATPSICCLPARSGEYTTLELWSPCGTWVAMQRCHPLKGNTLIIWNTMSGETRQGNDRHEGFFLKMAWLPGTSWLLWVTSCNCAHESLQQSIFCLNLMTDERHELLGAPDRWQRRHEPIIAATGSMMAYVSNVFIVLLSLPHLKQETILSSSVHDRPCVESMSFCPSAAYIAVCWDGQGHATNAGRPRLCLEVFDTATHARCFSVPLESKARCAWSPASSLLYIVTTSATYMLDVASLGCNLVNIAADFTRGSLAWAADGRMAVLLESFSCSPPNASFYGKCIAVLGDGTTTKVTVDALGPVVMVSTDWQAGIPLLGAYGGLQAHLACRSSSADKFELQKKLRAFWKGNDHSHHTRFISPCSRLEVKIIVSYQHENMFGWLAHLALDFAALTAHEEHVTLNSIPASSRPCWHPAAASSRIYALASDRHGVWLIDGQRHRFLQNLHPMDLLELAHNTLKRSLETNATWHRMFWCQNGTKLLLVGRMGLVALDFADTPISQQSTAAKQPAKERIASKSKLARLWRYIVQK